MRFTLFAKSFFLLCVIHNGHITSKKYLLFASSPGDNEASTFLSFTAVSRFWMAPKTLQAEKVIFSPQTSKRENLVGTFEQFWKVGKKTLTGPGIEPETSGLSHQCLFHVHPSQRVSKLGFSWPFCTLCVTAVHLMMPHNRMFTELLLHSTQWRNDFENGTLSAKFPQWTLF